MSTRAVDIDMSHEPITAEPCSEEDDMSVIPRCIKVAAELSPLVERSIRMGSVAIITHGEYIITYCECIIAHGECISTSVACIM